MSNAKDIGISNTIYVQHSEGKPMMTISFEYTANGKTKSFNLYRRADEPLSHTLDRIKLNLARLTRDKKSKKNVSNNGDDVTEFDLQLIRNDYTIDPNESMNVDAWIEGAIMKLDGNSYVIRRNEPQVTLMTLPTTIMKDFIVLPSVDLANCDIHDCRFHWYRQISAQEREQLETNPNLSDKIISDRNAYWLHLATGLTYSPSIDDVAHHLKVICHPSNGTKEGPSYSCLSGRSVELGPVECPFVKRHARTSKQFEKCETIRFVTYNILADIYADQDYSRKVLFAHCPAYALELDYRRQLLLKEIHGYNGDIVCLQEVDRKEFKRTYEPYFKLVTHHVGVYNSKGGPVPEGLATFFRDDRFELIDTHRTILSRLIDPTNDIVKSETDSVVPPACDDEDDDLNKHPLLDNLASSEAQELLKLFDEIRFNMKSNLRLLKRFMDRHTVLQITLLRFKDMLDTYVVVANTHLYFAPDADHIRILQGSICVKYIEFMKGYYERLIKTKTGQIAPTISAIFCGDMNSSPDCGLFKLLHEGRIDEGLRDWYSNEEESIQGLVIETSLKFSSACKDLPYTNYTPGFNGCLDYIYYELNGFDCIDTVPLPDHKDVTVTGGIPSDVFPSDHLALIAHLKFKK